MFAGRPTIATGIPLEGHQKKCELLASELGHTITWDWFTETAYGPVGMAQGQVRDFNRNKVFHWSGEKPARADEPARDFDAAMAAHQADTDAMFAGGYQPSEALLRTLPATTREQEGATA